MELNEHEAAMDATKQPKLYDNRFSSCSVLAFQELRLIKAHHVICMTVRKKINRRFEVFTLEGIN